MINDQVLLNSLRAKECLRLPRPHEREHWGNHLIHVAWVDGHGIQAQPLVDKNQLFHFDGNRFYSIGNRKLKRIIADAGGAIAGRLLP